MEFQGLTDKQTEAMLSLTEICGVELDRARSLLEKADWNLEHAMNMHFNPQQEVAHQPYEEVRQPQQQRQPQVNYPVPNEYMEQPYYENDYDENQDPAFAKYRNFRFSGATFESNYPNNSAGIKGVFSWVANKFKGESSAGERFKNRVQESFPRANKINFQKGSFLDAMYLVKKEKFPLIVVVYDFANDSRELFKNLISNSSVSEFFNTTFRVIGFDVQGYEGDELLRARVDRKNVPCIAVFKVDECEEIALMDVVELVPETDFKELKKRLNSSKSKHIKDQIRQSEYGKRFINQLNGNYDANPMSFQRKLQLQEERRIKKIQEKELREQDKQIQLKRKEQQEALQAEKKKQKDGEKLLEQRRINRENFKLHSQGVRFRLRLPNGNQLIVTVPEDFKIQYLFDFVECQEDIGLEENIYRKFDIIRPYDKLTLGEVKDKTLREVFGDTESESLVVNEL